MLTKPVLGRLAASSQSVSRRVTASATTKSLATTQQSRALTSSAARRLDSDHGHPPHESHYDPPGGWLWGVRPGEKAEKEGWEGVFYWLYCAPIVIAGVAYAMKEDTSIQTWALEEAQRRLEKEGILEDKSA